MTRQSAFRRLSPQATPVTARLFCLPYAGAGGGVYHGWVKHLPAHVELVAATYAGREARAGEAPATRLSAVVDDMVRAIRGSLDLPYVLFGHSMGALVAFELARRLAASHPPEQVIVSGARSPLSPRVEPLHALPPRDFFRALVTLGGFPPEALGEPELIAYALPILRADFTACETHVVDLDGCGRFPLSAIGGDADPRVGAAHVDDWRGMSAVGFSSRIFGGGHFFLRDHVAELVADAVAPLRGLAARHVA